MEALTFIGDPKLDPNILQLYYRHSQEGLVIVGNPHIGSLVGLVPRWMGLETGLIEPLASQNPMPQHGISDVSHVLVFGGRLVF